MVPCANSELMECTLRQEPEGQRRRAEVRREGGGRRGRERAEAERTVGFSGQEADRRFAFVATLEYG